MKANLVNLAFGILVAGAVTSASAQSTWNYFISDAGDGNSLLTWNVTGDLATPPGATLLVSESSLAVSVDAPGIYTDAYLADGTPQSLPTPDGSYFQLKGGDVFASIISFATDNASGSANDGFGSIATLPPRTGPGIQLLYIPGTQSVLIPVVFSDFNPGTYQSQELIFDTTLTVNLTVESVPEPSMPTLIVAAGIGAGLTRKRVRIAG